MKVVLRHAEFLTRIGRLNIAFQGRNIEWKTRRRTEICLFAENEEIIFPLDGIELAEASPSMTVEDGLTWFRVPARLSKAREERRPINAEDFGEAAALRCQCDTVWLGRPLAVKALPSEQWAELMDFWHCHKPHVHGGQDKSRVLKSQVGSLLLGINILVVHPSDTQNLEVGYGS
jgi:hypothetical protein